MIRGRTVRHTCGSFFFPCRDRQLGGEEEGDLFELVDQELMRRRRGEPLPEEQPPGMSPLGATPPPGGREAPISPILRSASCFLCRFSPASSKARQV